jgi:hypothetical protein
VFVSVTRQQHTLEGEAVEVEKQQKKRFDVLCWNENGAVEIITGILL